MTTATIDPIALGLTRDTAQAQESIIQQARRVACAASFAHFLRYVKTEEGDYPLWQFQEDLATRIERGEWLIVLKRRQVMFSWTTAALAAWTAAYGANPSHVALFSKDEDTVMEIVRRAKVILDNLPDYLKVKYRGSNPLTILDNGNFIKPFPATQSAGIGRAYKLAIFDEFSEHVYAKDNLAKVTPAVTNSKGQILIGSASNPQMGPAGEFYRIWDRAYGTPEKSAYKAVFVGRNARPDQQGEEWLEEEKAKYGDIGDAYFNALYPENPGQAFLSQTGLVYGVDPNDNVAIFDYKRNVVQKPAVPWADCTFRLVGLDSGGDHPSAMVAVGVRRDEGQPNTIISDRFHAYATKRVYGALSVDQAHEFLTELQVRGRIHKVLVDPSQKSLIASLERRGWPVEKMSEIGKNPINRREFIGTIKHLFKTGRLTILDGDPMLKEIESYWWDEDAREFIRSGQRANFTTRTPNWHHADLLDAMRYALAGAYKYYPGRRKPMGQRMGRATDLVSRRY